MKDSADFTIDSIRKFAATRGITGFASGGVHSGGLRIVGERGPELEVTAPSTIYSTDRTKELLGSRDIVFAIRDLINVVLQGAEYNKKTSDILLRVTRDGESLRTVAAA